MAYRDDEVRRERDRERWRRRTARRRAAGLCVRCGARPPAAERSECESCAEKSRAAKRARAARLRAEGKPLRDRSKARAAERKRYRRTVDAWRAAGLCVQCGRRPTVPERTLCEPCAERRRAADRARYAAGKAAGLPYGGANPDPRRRRARAVSRRRRQERGATGLCVRCGARPPIEGGRACERCRARRQAADRKRYAERRDAGRCGRCGRPAFDGAARCAPCATLEAARRPQERRNAASRRRYAERRDAGRCTDCNRPSQGAARCEPCARRSYERSEHFRGLPLYPPEFNVIDRTTGDDLGTWNSWEEVSMCLAFGRLSYDQVEVLVDEPVISRYAAWE